MVSGLDFGLDMSRDLTLTFDLDLSRSLCARTGILFLLMAFACAYSGHQ